MDTIDDGVGRAAYTLSEWCDAYRISRSKYYGLKKLGLAPRTIKVGSKNSDHSRGRRRLAAPARERGRRGVTMPEVEGPARWAAHRAGDRLRKRCGTGSNPRPPKSVAKESQRVRQPLDDLVALARRTPSVCSPAEAIIALDHDGGDRWTAITANGPLHICTRHLIEFGWFRRQAMLRLLLCVGPRPSTAAWAQILNAAMRPSEASGHA